MSKFKIKKRKAPSVDDEEFKAARREYWRLMYSRDKLRKKKKRLARNQERERDILVYQKRRKLADGRCLVVGGSIAQLSRQWRKISQII